MNKLGLFVIFLFVGYFAKANIDGTEFQNFNPSVTGLDFTTVHSSETLKPCMCNLGVFFNYAKNTLTYSDKYYQTNTDLRGKRVNDYLVGGDLNLGIGLTKNWDLGIGLPFIVAAHNEDPYGVTYFDRFGLTEARPMTKVRFYGDDEGGLAVVLSANFNAIDNNPFSGERPGATLNIELAGDTTTSSGYKLAANVGYRKRNSGKQITDPVTGTPAPFVPFKDAFIFSTALAKYFQLISSELMVELEASRTGKLVEDDSVRKSQQAFEADVGFRHEWSKTLNLHGGLGTKLADAQASPDIRVYLGMNYQFGPVCVTSTSQPREFPTAVVSNVPVGNSKRTKLSMPVSAKNLDTFRFKLGPTSLIDCTKENGYSEELPGTVVIQTDIYEVPDGSVTLCAIAKNESGIWQQLTSASIYKWKKESGLARLTGPVPHAIVYNHPSGVSNKIDLKMPVSAEDKNDYQSYRWKLGASPETDCTAEDGYSKSIPGLRPIVTSVGEIPDGGITLCAVARNNKGDWQPFSDPTIIMWTKKVGYELFRLNAEVLFDFDKDTLQKRAYGELEKIAKHLRARPFEKCVIEGHTDSKGSDTYNQDLSRRRALRVKNYLIETFEFESKQFQSFGRGEKFPVESNKTDEGRRKNRRVEFKIYRK